MPWRAVLPGEIERPPLGIEIRDAVVLLDKMKGRLVAQTQIQRQARAQLDVVLDVDVVGRERQVGRNARQELEAAALAEQLRTQYPSSSYATFVALAQAKQAAEAGELNAAQQHLRWVMEHAGEATDRALASLRLARVLLDQGQAQAAQDVLSKDIPASSAALAELRGDIARAQDKPQDARQAYQEALANLPPDSGQAALIKLKLDGLVEPVSQPAGQP